MKRSLKWQILLPLTGLLTISLIAITIIGYLQAKKYVTEYAMESTQNKIRYFANRVNTQFLLVSKIVEDLAIVICDDYQSKKKEKLIDRHIEEWAKKNGSYSGIWYNTESSYMKQGYNWWWYLINNGKVEEVQYTPSTDSTDDPSLPENQGNPDYDYYQGARRDGKTHFTAPYVDPDIKVAMLSVSTPVYDQNKRIMGVAGIDINLTGIQKIAAEILIGKTGQAIFATEDGEIIYHPDKRLIMKKNLLKNYDKIMKAVFSKAVKSDECIQKKITNGMQKYYFSARIPSTKWVMLVAVPEKEITGVVEKILFSSLIILLVVLLLVTIIILRIVSKILEPINSLKECAEKIAGDDLSGNITIIRSGNELEDLSESFYRMQLMLKKVASLAGSAADGRFGDDNDGLKIEHFGELTGAFFKTIENLKLLVGEVSLLTTQASQGNLSVRGNVNKFSGAYKEIIEGINATLTSITEPIREAATVLGEMSDGNLQVYMTGAYKGDYAQIKCSLNNLNEYLNKIIGRINKASQQVDSAGKQVANSSQALAQGSAEQAASIEEIISSINEAAEKIKQNALNARRANELTQDAKDAAFSGKDQMQEMQRAMEEINSASTNIAKIIKVIDEIAFQTNILALNAAVEAARAGEHGKGFAVVADEVRNLAVKSANAAKDTTVLIEGSIGKVIIGKKVAEEAAEALKRIVETITNASTLIEEIALLSNEQANTTAQINQAINQIAQVTEINTASAEESAVASQELSSEAEILKNMVQKFKLKDNKKDISAIIAEIREKKLL